MQLSTSPSPSRLSYCVVGVNHRSLPVAQRELLAKINGADTQFLPELAENIQVKEAALLSTCNRFEVIVVAPQGEPLSQLPRRIIEFLRAKVGGGLLPEHFYQLLEGEAVRHVFRVSSSLDSLVLGEAQILGQVKECYERARQLGLADKHLHQLFQFSFRMAKRIRSSTSIGAGAVSVSYVAVRLAEQIFGDLSKVSVLVLGSGQMAELALLHLKARGCEHITIANRTLERATELAAKIGGAATGLDDLERIVGEFDVVVGSLSIDRPILDTQRVKKILGSRAQFFIDLGVPRNFPESVGQVDDVYLYTIDDLSKISDEHRGIREESQQDADIMIEYGLLQFDRWLTRVAREPTILDLRAQIEEICRQELEERLSVESEEFVSEIAYRLTEKISHRIVELIERAPGADSVHPEIVSLFIEDLLRRPEK